MLLPIDHQLLGSYTMKTVALPPMINYCWWKNKQTNKQKRTAHEVIVIIFSTWQYYTCHLFTRFYRVLTSLTYYRYFKGTFLSIRHRLYVFYVCVTTLLGQHQGHWGSRSCCSTLVTFLRTAVDCICFANQCWSLSNALQYRLYLCW